MLALGQHDLLGEVALPELREILESKYVVLLQLPVRVAHRLRLLYVVSRWLSTWTLLSHRIIGF